MQECKACMGTRKVKDPVLFRTSPCKCAYDTISDSGLDRGVCPECGGIGEVWYPCGLDYNETKLETCRKCQGRGLRRQVAKDKKEAGRAIEQAIEAALETTLPIRKRSKVPRV